MQETEATRHVWLVTALVGCTLLKQIEDACVQNR